MIRLLPGLALASWASVAAASSNSILIVVADDPELAGAVVSAASRQYGGPVAQAPAHWSGGSQPPSIRLQVARLDDRRWRLTLIGTDAVVSKEITLSENSRQLDVAEAVALAVPGLASKVEARSRAASRSHDLAVTPPVCPAVEAHPAPSAASADAGHTPAAAVAVPEDALPAVPPEPPLRRWVVALMPSMFFSSETTSPSAGGEAVGGFAITRTWIAELSAGGYASYAWKYNVQFVPIDALIAARFEWNSLVGEIGIGPELSIAVSPIGTNATIGVAAAATAGYRITDSWMVGLRAVGADTPASPNIGPPQGQGQGQGPGNESIFLSQATMRLGLLVQWTP